MGDRFGQTDIVEEEEDVTAAVADMTAAVVVVVVVVEAAVATFAAVSTPSNRIGTEEVRASDMEWEGMGGRMKLEMK